MVATDVDKSLYTIPNKVPVCLLDCKKAFQGLETKEKQYCHYLSKASEEGGLIVLLQTSPESVPVFLLLQRLFGSENVDSLQSKSQAGGVNEEEFKALLSYAAGFYCNMGNYKSFGDTKIIPGLSKEKFWKVIQCSSSYEENSTWFDKVWNACCNDMYNLDKRRRELGIGEKGVSTYYSSNITEEDITTVQKFMTTKNLSPYNTRLFKDSDGKFDLRLASMACSDKFDEDDTIHELLGENVFESRNIKITRGDYSPLMKRIVSNLTNAKNYVANENEEKMIENYIKCFTYGSIEAHKDGSRYWIKDQGPIVETYIGFIESYRDPYGVRGEYEGFVSIVNKDMSAKFGVLVEQAPKLLQLLPWPKEYEKDVFLRPDFTSLDILTFAGSGIPAGINIPNYDDIRQDEGFKNVSLGNVLQAKPSGIKIAFLSTEDEELLTKYKGPAFEVQVGLHELLGHGSGKLFQQKEDGTFNFDNENVEHLETHEKITTWYRSGETWDTKFSTLASSYEECRAECVGLLLCLDLPILRIFGHEGEEANQIIYTNWLNMVHAGLLGLQFYSPETESWKQAHMNARHVILKVLMEADESLVQIETTQGEDGKPDLLIKLDREKILTSGKDAISNFLMRLQLYKATADYDSGKAMYQKYSHIDDSMLLKRQIVLDRKQPRRLFVQCNTKIQDGDVQLHEYEASCAGLIRSNIDRYQHHDQELESLWKAESSYHNY